MVHHFRDGKSLRTIRKLVKVSHSTVFAFVKRWKLRGTVKVKLTKELEKRFIIKK